MPHANPIKCRPRLNILFSYPEPRSELPPRVTSSIDRATKAAMLAFESTFDPDATVDPFFRITDDLIDHDVIVVLRFTDDIAHNSVLEFCSMQDRRMTSCQMARYRALLAEPYIPAAEQRPDRSEPPNSEGRSGRLH